MIHSENLCNCTNSHCTNKHKHNTENLCNCRNIKDISKHTNIKIWKRTYNTVKDGLHVLNEIVNLLKKHNLLWLEILDLIEQTEDHLITPAIVCKLDQGVETLLKTISELLETPRETICGNGGTIFKCETSTESELVLYGETELCSTMKFCLPTIECRICVRDKCIIIESSCFYDPIDSFDLFDKPSLICNETLTQTITLEEILDKYEIEKERISMTIDRKSVV